MNEPVIPVVLFTYTRSVHLMRVLSCLQENKVPLIYAFSDGAKGKADVDAVSKARGLLRSVDWAELKLIERPQNLGLGRNVLAGVSQVAETHETFIVWEDDLICVPGCYDWLCTALRHYADNIRVMSVTAWNHPRVIPKGIGEQSYFDGRAECWVWGTWRRAWLGMPNENAVSKMLAAERRGVARNAYGGDLPPMAFEEEIKNIWAVRWLYHHLLHGGLCLRPPWSMVEHIGFDKTATNASGAGNWANEPLPCAPPLPAIWPEPVVHPDCGVLWKAANPSGLKRLWWRLRAFTNV